MKIKKKVFYLLSHPIQYQSPLMREISTLENLDLTVLFCSEEGATEYFDRQYGRKIKYDTPLLQGFNFVFLKNYSPFPSVFNNLYGLINFGVLKKLYKDKPDLLVVHGWSYLTHIMAIIFASLLGIKVALRSENPYHQEIKKRKHILFLKKILLGSLLFKCIDYFLYIGNKNKEFYRFYNIPESKCFFAPYCIDNNFFKERAIKDKEERTSLRSQFNITEEDHAFLFVGKLISKKRPLDIIEALNKVKNRSFKLILVGDGELKDEVSRLMEEYGLSDKVILTGFINQSELPKYYSIADSFILPSGQGETWGLVVNEAMCYGLPIVSSSTVGSSFDLVTPKTGESFTEGNIEELSKILSNFTRDTSHLEHSYISKYIEKYSFKTVCNSISQIVHNTD
ncbi:MAG: hypothetical protein BM556_09005 [Bacteriovorax sp. MedPE-SWde]|nr:MAG: hypothetical protein BM556_09005 [Bacteriovorax sp. MedPE-SWde]